MKCTLAEPHIEVHIKVGKRLLDLAQLKFVATLTGDGDRCITVKVKQLGIRSENALGKLSNVGARVTVFRSRLALSRSQDGCRKIVHLVAGIVDVELTHEFSTGSFQHPSERIAQRCPASVPDVQRAGGIRRNELQIDGLTRERIIATVSLALFDDDLRKCASGSGIQRDVNEAGASDIHRSNAVDRSSLFGDFGREFARVCSQRLRQLHSDVGCPITVIAVAGSL